MSSSSSNEDCDYCQCYDDNDYGRYGRASENNHHMPFGNMGQPLIYFAQIPMNKKQQKKENRNCFVKAFKWYTQEREPEHKYCTTVYPERIGFANWLDVKYFEYLRERNQVYQVNALPASITTPCSKLNCPKKKRRRLFKDAGDLPDKNINNQSCEFIMQPKDITRAASECCFQTTLSVCNKSNATVASSSAPGTTKGLVKSSSVSTVFGEPKGPKRIDVIPQEGIHRFDEPCCACASNGKPKSRREQMQQVPSKNQRSEIGCQFPEEIIIRITAQTQYETTKKDVPILTESYTCCICTPTPTSDAVHPEVPPSTTPAAIKQSQGKSPHSKMSFPSPSKPKLKKSARLDPDRMGSIICYCPVQNIATEDFESQYPSEAVLMQANDLIQDNVQSGMYPSATGQDTQQAGLVPTRSMRSYTVVVNEAPCTCSNEEGQGAQENTQLYRPISVIKRQSTEITLFKPVMKHLQYPTPVIKPRSTTSTQTHWINNICQTSDHAISLDHIKRPMFIKLVCGEKLKSGKCCNC